MKNFCRCAALAYLFFALAPFEVEAKLLADTYPTLKGLRNTLEVQASWDAKVAKAKAEDFVDLRFVDQLKSSGFHRETLRSKITQCFAPQSRRPATAVANLDVAGYQACN